ncbi:MAG TPA: hypothetical protein VFJ85_16640 [Acidimicrobiales bacterium]|nr:hypothetical protein [Acidimicrobiales bacterium]
MAGHADMRVFGFPLTVDPSFLVMAVLLGLGGRPDLFGLATWVVVLAVGVVGHELGHALALRVFGQDSRIHLYAMGGVTVPTTRPPAGRRQHPVVVSLAGPVPGIVVGAALLAVARPSTPYSPVDVIVLDLVLVTIGLGLLNLMPVLPLDGGRALAGLLASRRGSDAAVLAVSAGVGLALCAAGLLVGQVWAGALFGYLGLFNASELWKRRRRRPPVTAEALDEGYQALAKGAGLAAANRAREVLAAVPAGPERDGAAELLLWSHLVEGDPEAAARAASDHPPYNPMAPLLHDRAVQVAGGPDRAVELLRGAFRAGPTDAMRIQLARGLVETGRLDEAVELVEGGRAPLLDNRSAAVVGAALFRAGRYADAARLGEASYARVADRSMAYNVACAWMGDGHRDEALAWLNRAVDAGYRNLAELDQDPNLAGLRGTPGFEQLRSRLA